MFKKVTVLAVASIVFMFNNQSANAAESSGSKISTSAKLITGSENRIKSIQELVELGKVYAQEGKTYQAIEAFEKAGRLLDN